MLGTWSVSEKQSLASQGWKNQVVMMIPQMVKMIFPSLLRLIQIFTVQEGMLESCKAYRKVTESIWDLESKVYSEKIKVCEIYLFSNQKIAKVITENKTKKYLSGHL